MVAYLDASVILRHLLRQPRRLAEWRLLRTPVTSRLTEVECLRTLDRLRVEGAYGEKDLAALREGVYRALASIEVVELARSILARASQPSPTSLGTLDAIHLCSALAWRERTGKHLAFATHDAALALAARANGLHVIGA
jgi:predicted nucleic acid-binding protein